MDEYTDKHPGKAMLGLADPLPASGKTMGYVRVPYSRNDSAYGVIAAPITVIAHGDGPTALLLAGSQGDEFEGQIALSRLAREIEPEEINGRIIIFPMANTSAAEVGQRNSPVDGLNLNRIYPGDIRGRITEITASYIERALMPEADFVLDLHSGGASMDYLPSAALLDHPDASERARRLALALAFGAPSLLCWKANEDRTSSGAARRAGTVRIAAEIGGGSRVTSAHVATTYNGVRNVLDWAGILPFPDRPATSATVVREVDAERDYVYAIKDGLFEPLVSLGDYVEHGQIVGRLHDPSTPGSMPHDIRMDVSGTVVCLRTLTKTARGDCLLHVGRTPQPQLLAEIEAARNLTWVSDQYKRRRPRVRRSQKGNDDES